MSIDFDNPFKNVFRRSPYYKLFIQYPTGEVHTSTFDSQSEAEEFSEFYLVYGRAVDAVIELCYE